MPLDLEAANRTSGATIRDILAEELRLDIDIGILVMKEEECVIWKHLSPRTWRGINISQLGSSANSNARFLFQLCMLFDGLQPCSEESYDQNVLARRETPSSERREHVIGPRAFKASKIRSRFCDP